MLKLQFRDYFSQLIVLKAMYIAHIKNLKVYTQNFLFSLISYPAQVLMFYFLWSAILESSNLVSIGTNDLLAYYLLAFLIERLTGNRNVTDNVEEDIVTGKLVVYFVRPIPIYSSHFAEYLSQLTINCLLMVPIALVLLEILTPNFMILNLGTLLIFSLFVFIAGICQFLIYFMIGILSFWLERVWGIRMGINWIISFLSGRLIPLYLFPIVLLNYIDFLPFRFFTYELIVILLYPTSILVIIGNLIFLSIWLIVLFLLCWVLLRTGSKKFMGYGV